MKRRRDDIRNIAETEERLEMLKTGKQSSELKLWHADDASNGTYELQHEDDPTIIARIRLQRTAQQSISARSSRPTVPDSVSTTSSGIGEEVDSSDSFAAAVTLPEPLAGPVALDGDIFSQIIELWDLLQTCVANEHVTLAMPPQLEKIGTYHYF